MKRFEKGAADECVCSGCYRPGELLGPSWLPDRWQNRVVSGLTPESLVTSWEMAAMRSAQWVAAILGAVVLGLLFSGMAHAQQRSGGSFGVGDLNTAVSGFRAVVAIATAIVPFGILAYYTWKMKAKDWYEAAWMAIGWCALAYILR